MNWGPEDVPASELLGHAIDYTLMACFAVESAFGIGPSSDLKALQQASNQLIEQSGAAG